MFKVNVNNTQWYEFSPGSGLELVTTIITETVSEDDTKIKYDYKRKYISNFWPEVINQVDVNNNGFITKFVQFKVMFTNNDVSEPESMELALLDKIDWPNDIDIRCALNPDVSKANEHIATIIRLNYHNAELIKTTVIDRLGTHIVEGIPLFCAGDRIIWPVGIKNKPSVKFKPLPNIRLVVDSKCSEDQAVAGMMKIILLSPEAGRIIFSLNMLCVQWEAFSKIDVVPHTIIYPHGQSGFKKTTYARFMTQIYNRDMQLESLTRFNASSAAAVQLLYEKSDSVFVLDDLFPAKSAEVTRQQEKTLLELTRILADSIEPARMRGKQVANRVPRRAGLFTGEYYLKTGTGSDDARLFPVKMVTPVDAIKLTECQEEPLVLSTFYSFYITWYITNFNEIVGLLKEWKAAYRSTRTGIHDRLQETQFCLEAAFKLFLTYCQDKGFISNESSQVQYNSFYQQLRNIVKEQNNRVNNSRGGEPRYTDYLQVIRTLYHDKRFSLVKCIKDFEPKTDDGIVHKDHLYFRRDKLLAKIRTIEPAADFDEAIEDLKRQQAFKKGEGNCNSRKLGGTKLRFYTIKLGKLQ